MFNINTASVKFRMTAVLGMLVLLAAGLVALVSLTLAERHMRKVLGDEQMALLSSAAAYIDQNLNAQRSLLAVLAERFPAEAMHDARQVQGVLEDHFTLRDEFFNVSAVNRHGDLVANLNDRRAIGISNFSDRAYFRDTVAAREGVISAPFRSQLSGKQVVLITQPVFDAGGQLQYILLGSIDLERPRFFGQIEAMRPSVNGFIFMLTTDGVIIHHPHKNRILGKVTEEPGGAMPATLKALQGWEGWVEGETKAGVPALMAYKRIRSTNWIVGAAYPLEDAFAPMLAMRRNALLGSVMVAVLAGAVGLLAIRWLLRPLGVLRRQVACMAEGQGEANIRVFDTGRRDEFGELSRAFYALSRQRELAEASLRALARTDTLTGISNRRMFEELFSAALARQARTGAALGLAYLDIDHFKRINDTHGHGVGDEVLIEFARRLKGAVRASDTVARLAGDEFVIIFDHLSSEAEPAALGAKILAAMEAPIAAGGLRLTVTASVGIALHSGGAAAMEDVIRTADEALYSAKAQGRRRCAVKRVTPKIRNIA
ncbi:GGDEF domain-containing protein [Massilia endophytica]|uniref:GGDEF domain-containing protein n=1 Tax=Massilia endophytica TaxID=2899220 RepID=UPI001E6077C0|nr:GGDEF domain-containing protein [Massilia endophytica]UGQ47775.1 diguanylate cyclase [Massilia endophytica]